MYSKEDEEILKEYPKKTVDELAAQLGKTKRSIVAKLSIMKIYEKPPKLTKAGEEIIKKEELVALIEEATDLELPTLVKTGKADLRKLVDWLQNNPATAS